MVLTGWGYDVDGARMPTLDSGKSFIPDVKKKYSEWMTGPVNLAWDSRHGTWTPPPQVILATMKDDMKNDDDEGEAVRDQELGRTTWTKPDNTITIKNRMKQEIAKDSLVLVYYHPGFDEWWIIQSQYYKNELVCDIDCDGNTLDIKTIEMYLPWPNNDNFDECGDSSSDSYVFGQSQ